MKSFLLVLILLAACSRTPVRLPPGTEVKYLPVDAHKGADYVSDQKTFLTGIFRENPLMEWEVPRWTKECLRENAIGDVQKSERATVLVSDLVMYGNLSGLCSGDYHKSTMNRLAYVHCSGEPSVIIVRCPLENCQITNWSDLCH